MTLNEMKMIFKTLQANYKYHFKELTQEESGIVLNLWYQLFKDDDVELVSVAVQKVIMESKYFPTIAEIKDKMYSIVSSDKMSTMDCFKLMKKAIRRDRQLAKEQYDKLPLEIQQAIGMFDNLCDYANMNEKDLENFIFPRFRDSLNLVRENEKDTFKSSNEMLETKERIRIGNEN